jgi:Serine/Threonine/Tyrosine Kinase found in polyvalent proteins
MIADEAREQLQNIIGGELQKGQVDPCTAARNILCESFGTGPTVKSEFESKAIIKEKQVGFLTAYARKEGLWLESLPGDCQYLTEGGESKVYLNEDGRSVVKINDAGYYATWTEYFNSLLLHNLLFPTTAYSLIGFTEFDGKLFAMMRQPFVEGEQAVLEHIEEFLKFNGFNKIRRQDYYNSELGLALEDMHDENVIANAGVLFFIDTVFYIMGK